MIFARNNHLKAEGIILPDKGYIYVQALEDGAYREKKLSFWYALLALGLMFTESK